MPPSETSQNIPVETARRLLDRAAVPDEWKVTVEQFHAALERSATRRFGDTLPNSKTLQAYFESLHLSDLALACACAAGNDAAWDFFVAQFRPELYRAARAIAGDSNARELADSLYAELYGLREVGGVRKSLFDYFHGRSKLSTWLRAILAQRHVDAIRRSRHTESLEESGEDASSGGRVAGAGKNSKASVDTERETYLAILQAALETVLGALDPGDRLRLACYYADGLTLAEIGRLMNEHEATVSRKLERTRRRLREQVDSTLRQRKLSDAQIQLCYGYAREEWPFDLAVRLCPVQAGTAGASQPAGSGQTG